MSDKNTKKFFCLYGRESFLESTESIFYSDMIDNPNTRIHFVETNWNSLFSSLNKYAELIINKLFDLNRQRVLRFKIVGCVTVIKSCMRMQVGMTPANYIDLYNLKPGGRYKFRVTARNRYGCGQPVDTVDYVDILEPKYLPYFHQQLPGETKILLHHSATLQCHVRKFVLLRFVRMTFSQEKAILFMPVVLNLFRMTTP